MNNMMSRHRWGLSGGGGGERKRTVDEDRQKQGVVMRINFLRRNKHFNQHRVASCVGAAAGQ